MVPKTTFVPVIVGALGMIKKGTEKHIKILGNESEREIQPPQKKTSN